MNDTHIRDLAAHRLAQLHGEAARRRELVPGPPALGKAARGRAPRLNPLLAALIARAGLLSQPEQAR